MPSFTFHLVDPSHGVQIARRDLPNAGEARCESSRLLGNALRQFPELLFHAGMLRLDVRDEEGTQLFSIEMNVRDHLAPPAAWQAPVAAERTA